DAALHLKPLALSHVAGLPDELSDAAEAIRVEAEAILGGNLAVLGSGWTYVGVPPDWHRDFKSGYRWPVSFYRDVEVTRLDDDSDAKVPWEISRSHHML